MADVNVTASITGFGEIQRRFAALDSRIAKLSKRFGAFGKTLTRTGKQLTTFVTLPLVAAGVAALKFASDLGEAQNAAQVALGDSAKAVEAFAATSAKSFGISKIAAFETAAQFGFLFTSAGAAQDVAADMAIELEKVAADLASITNVSGGTSAALAKLRAGLVGEAEPLRALNIFLNDNIVRQKAVQLGLARTTKEVTDQSKILARYQLILEQAEFAQGDFANTSDEIANSMRIMRAALVDAGASLGQEFLPVATDAVKILRDLIAQFNDLTPAAKKTIAIIAAGFAAGGPLLVGLGLTFTAVSILTTAFVALVAPILAVAAALAVGLAVATAVRGAFKALSNVALVMASIFVETEEIIRSWTNEAISSLDLVALAVKDPVAALGVFATRTSKTADNTGAALDRIKSQFALIPDAVKTGFTDSFDETTGAIAQFGTEAVDAFKRIGADINNIVFAPAVPEPILIQFRVASGLKQLDELAESVEATGTALSRSIEQTAQAAVDTAAKSGEAIRFSSTEALAGFLASSQSMALKAGAVITAMADTMMGAFNQAARGIAQAMATAVVAGQSAADAIKSIVKDLAITVIATIIEIGLKTILVYAYTAFAAAYSAIAAIPIIGPFLAPVVAAAALAAVLGGAFAVVQSLDVGTDFVAATGPAIIHRGERVIPAADNATLIASLQSANRPLAPGGGQSVSVTNNMNGLVIFDDISASQFRRRLMADIETTMRKQRGRV